MPARLLLDCRNQVGESPVWSAADQALYWVDIVGSAIHRFDPTNGSHHRWPTPELPTSIGLRRAGGLIVGLRHRIAVWKPDGPFETIAVPEPDKPGNRLNEGAVAPDGSFWVGTMQDNIGPQGEPEPITPDQGCLYRIGEDGQVTRLTDHAFGITNTMVWSDDGGFITADTMADRLYRFAVGPDGLSDRENFGPAIGRGVPDGSARDRDGTIYNARVGGGAGLAHIAPDGTLLGMIELPCSSPTSCAFGGPDLTTLFVTSARFGLPPEHLDANPSEGGLFALDLPTPGLLPNLFAG